MSSVAYNCPTLLRQSNLVLSVLGGSRTPRTSQDPHFMSLSTSCPCCLENPLDIPGSSLHVSLTQLSGGSFGHPGILPLCPSHTAVWGVSRTSWDPPFMSLSHNCPMLSRGSLGHPRILPWSPLRHRPTCCPEDPLDVPGSSLGVPSDTCPTLSGVSLGHPGILPWCPLRHRSHTVRRIPWTS